MVTPAGVADFLESIAEVCSLLLLWPRLRRETSDPGSGDGGASASLSFLEASSRSHLRPGVQFEGCCRAAVLGPSVQFGNDVASR